MGKSSFTLHGCVSIAFILDLKGARGWRAKFSMVERVGCGEGGGDDIYLLQCYNLGPKWKRIQNMSARYY